MIIIGASWKHSIHVTFFLKTPNPPQVYSKIFKVNLLIFCSILRLLHRNWQMFSFFFSKRGYRVRSFGTGNQVKLPGSAPDKPNIYDFHTTYDEMYKDLLRKDPELYPRLWFIYLNIIFSISLQIWYGQAFRQGCIVLLSSIFT